MTTEAQNVVKRWYGAVGAGDWERMRNLMTEDFQNHYPPSIEEEPMSREELIEFFQHFEWWANIHDLFSDSNKVAVRLSITNKQVKEFERLPPGDEKRSVEGLVMWRVENGKVAEAWAFPDTHSFMEQLGLTSPTILWTVPQVLVRKLLP